MFKHVHITAMSMNQHDKTNITSVSSKYIPITGLSSNQQLMQLLRVMEPQLTLSYRKAFVPYYEKPIVPILNRALPHEKQRKMSIASSRRTSSVMSVRKRDSNVNLLNALTSQSGSSRLSLPPVSKQQKQSIVA